MIRVIPSVLVMDHSQVKGSGFDNWRVVGNPIQAARVHSRRDVDEVLLLDVSALSEGRTINPVLVEKFSSIIGAPLTVGGGIASISHVSKILRNGADRVCIGSNTSQRPGVIRSLADTFGSQSIVCSLDMDTSHEKVRDSLTGEWKSVNLGEYIRFLANEGAGEILLQRVDLDGLMTGIDVKLVQKVANLSPIPIIASSGLSGVRNAVDAACAGAAAIAGGALFQFTEQTPGQIRKGLRVAGFKTRE